MVLSVVAGVAVFAIGIFLIWYLVVRGSDAEAVTEDEFNDELDELAAEGSPEPTDRAQAWNDFQAWQHEARLRGEEGDELGDEGIGALGGNPVTAPIDDAGGDVVGDEGERLRRKRPGGERPTDG
jgi:hypothetical protein